MSVITILSREDCADAVSVTPPSDEIDRGPATDARMNDGALQVLQGGEWGYRS